MRAHYKKPIRIVGQVLVLVVSGFGPVSAEWLVQMTSANLKVLIVDDIVDSSHILALLLRQDGYEVQTATSGPEGVALAQNFRPEIVLLDIGLPGITGYEVARLMREELQDELRMLIAFTGRDSENDKREAKAAGFDKYLTKPVDYKDLQAMLASLD